MKWMTLTVSQLFVLNFTLGMSFNININNTFVIFHLTLILTLKLKIQRCKVRQIGWPSFTCFLLSLRVFLCYLLFDYLSVRELKVSFQMNWCTRRKNSKPSLMNLIKRLLKCQDTKCNIYIKIILVVQFSLVESFIIPPNFKFKTKHLILFTKHEVPMFWSKVQLNNLFLLLPQVYKQIF